MIRDILVAGLILVGIALYALACVLLHDRRRHSSDDRLRERSLKQARESQHAHVTIEPLGDGRWVATARGHGDIAIGTKGECTAVAVRFKAEVTS